MDRKHVILVGDGMADFPIPELENRTPLEVAHTPNMDALACEGICGLAQTVPEGMPPGSDTANLSIFGYDPKIYYSGRAPLEALSMGIDLNPEDAAFRCNMITLENGIMKDFSGGHIDSALSQAIISELIKNMGNSDIELHAGVSYRNLFLWRNYPCKDIPETTPPHDITDQKYDSYLPQGPCSEEIRTFMANSTNIISESQSIKDTQNKYKGTANSTWIWGGGRRPSMETLTKRYGLQGYTISAVDLIHGIGRAAGLQPIEVEGATGYIDTNYEGKAQACIDALDSCNFIVVHVESPDESGHQGNIEYKLQAIEDFDKKIVGPIWSKLKEYKNFSLLVMPDHPTPVSLKTHTSDPVPFTMIRTDGFADCLNNTLKSSAYSEAAAADTGLMIDKGHKLIDILISGEIEV